MATVIKDKDKHAKISRCLLESEVLDDVLMIQVFQSLALQLQRLHNRHLTTIVPVVLCPRNLDLFDSNHFTGGGVQRDVHFSIRTLADEFSSNPFEDRYHEAVSSNVP